MKENIDYLKLFILIISTFLSFNSFGQLNGSYTIGGNNPDYNTISSAINDLTNNGVSGSVVFNIRPGTYSGFSLGSINNLSSPDSVIFQSETLNPVDVIISSNTGTVNLNGTKAITLRWLTIEATGTDQNVAVNFNQSFNCNIFDCIIKTPNSKGNSYDKNAAISIKHNWNNPPTSIKIKNCDLTGSGSGFFVTGNTGTTEIIGCKIISTGKYAIYASLSTQLLTVESSTLNGELSLRGTNCPYFKNNIIISSKIVIYGFYEISDNEFMDIYPANPLIRAVNINGNIFNGYSNITADNYIKDNIFYKKVSVNQSSGSKFYNNKIYDEASFSFCYNIHLAYNEFFQKVRVSSDYAQIFCNLFYKPLTIGSEVTRVYYNNFSDSAYLYSQLFAVETRYNNFSQEANIPYFSKRSHNNYFPSGGAFDANSFNYDPQYIDSNNIRAQNPLLIGKGEFLTLVTKDIDGIPRTHNPSIGANEICISSLNNIDGTNLVCGDELNLKLCSNSIGSNYYWSPSTGLNDTLSNSPIAKPLNTTRYYLRDSSGAAVDSALIVVNDFIPKALQDVSMLCYYAAVLNGTYNPSAGYSWYPSTGLSDTAIHNPIAKPDTTITYYLQTSIPGCGVFYDTVLVEVDPNPIAYVDIYIYESVASFFNYSACADSFLWNFGDGNISNDVDPTHNYDSVGIYHGSLVAFNAYSSDTFYFTINVTKVGIDDLDPENHYYDIYPNPTRGLFTIATSTEIASENYTLEIFDLSGRSLYRNKVRPFNGNIKVNIEHFSAGVYLLTISSDHHNFKSFKIIKE